MATGLQGERQDPGGTRGLASGARPLPDCRRTILGRRMPTLYPTRSQVVIRLALLGHAYVALLALGERSVEGDQVRTRTLFVL